MRWRWVVLVLSLVVIASNVPLYRMVSKDYIPTNVDEGEFEVSVTAPEGATLRTMQATLETVEAELQPGPGHHDDPHDDRRLRHVAAQLSVDLRPAHRHGRAHVLAGPAVA